MSSLEIFSQGEEIVTGQTVDTNAAWLSEQAVQLGFTVTRHTAVGDKLDDLVATLKDISLRADCCLCTGGLGPTCDDLTAEAVAKAFDLPLQFDAEAFEQISRFYRARKRTMPEINRKQAMLPKGSVRLDNDWGTAPGFALQAGRCRFAFMPGVPSEMRQMFSERIKPMLQASFNLSPCRLITIKTVGIGESDIQQLIGEIEIPDQVRLGFRAGVDEVQTKLLFPGAYPEPAMAELSRRIADRITDAFVFAIDGLSGETGNLAAVVDRMMVHAGKSLLIVETINQGLLAAKCLGANWLHAALYEPSLTALGQRYGVSIDKENLAQSSSLLANAIWQQNSADIVLVQFYQGRREQFYDREQAVELITTLAHNIELEESYWSQERVTLSGPPLRKQNQAALFALNMLRRHLQTNH